MYPSFALNCGKIGDGVQYEVSIKQSDKWQWDSTGIMLDREDFEELTPGLSRYWLMQHQIVVYEATAAYRSVVDSWMNSVIDVMEHWPVDRPYLVIHDFRGKNLVFSPYARKRSQDLILISPQMPGFAAILIQMSIVGYAIQWFMRTAKTGSVDNRIFFNFDEALDWLKTHIKSLQPQVGKPDNTPIIPPR